MSPAGWPGMANCFFSIRSVASFRNISSRRLRLLWTFARSHTESVASMQPWRAVDCSAKTLPTEAGTRGTQFVPWEFPGKSCRRRALIRAARRGFPTAKGKGTSKRWLACRADQAQYPKDSSFIDNAGAKANSGCVGRRVFVPTRARTCGAPASGSGKKLSDSRNDGGVGGVGHPPFGTVDSTLTCVHIHGQSNILFPT